MPGHSSLKVHFHLKGGLKDAVMGYLGLHGPGLLLGRCPISSWFLFCNILFIEGLSMQSPATSFLGDKEEYEMDPALKVLTV